MRIEVFESSSNFVCLCFNWSYHSLFPFSWWRLEIDTYQKKKKKKNWNWENLGPVMGARERLHHRLRTRARQRKIHAIIPPPPKQQWVAGFIKHRGDNARSSLARVNTVSHIFSSRKEKHKKKKKKKKKKEKEREQKTRRKTLYS